MKTTHPILSPKDQAAREVISSSPPRYATTHELLQTELRVEILLLALFTQLKDQNMTVKEALAAFATSVNTAFTKLGTAVDGVATDVQGLKDQIAALQNSPDDISAEDQATLDAIQGQANAIADKVQALDDATAPAAAPVPPTPTNP